MPSGAVRPVPCRGRLDDEDTVRIIGLFSSQSFHLYWIQLLMTALFQLIPARLRALSDLAPLRRRTVRTRLTASMLSGERPRISPCRSPQPAPSVTTIRKRSTSPQRTASTRSAGQTTIQLRVVERQLVFAPPKGGKVRTVPLASGVLDRFALTSTTSRPPG
jgi:hypothetical protein